MQKRCAVSKLTWKQIYREAASLLKYTAKRSIILKHVGLSLPVIRASSFNLAIVSCNFGFGNISRIPNMIEQQSHIYWSVD